MLRDCYNVLAATYGSGVATEPECLRAFGTHLPGFITAGTFFRDGERSFWNIRDGRTAVVIPLKNEKYHQIVVETDYPRATESLVNSAVQAEWHGDKTHSLFRSVPTPPLARTRLSGVIGNTSFHVPAAAHTSASCSRSGSMKMRRFFSNPKDGTPRLGLCPVALDRSSGRLTCPGKYLRKICPDWHWLDR
jgi:hypothetical protein